MVQTEETGPWGQSIRDQGAKGQADVLKDHPTLEELDMY